MNQFTAQQICWYFSDRNTQFTRNRSHDHQCSWGMMRLQWLTFVFSLIVLQAPNDALQSKAPVLPCAYTGQVCTYDVLNFTSNAIRQLRALQLTNLSLIAVVVNRVISLRPDGALLQVFGYFTECIYYSVYYEPILRIPADCQLQELEVHSATQLQTIAVSGSNAHLRVLVLSKTAMRTIPRSLQSLSALTNFVASDGQLQVVNLEAFRSVRNLATVGLARNKVRALEVSTDPELTVAAQDIILANNELEFIDMEFFVPLRRLRFVDLHSNRLKQIVVPQYAISLPTVSAILLTNNHLTQLNVTGWNAPMLSTIEVESNNLTRLPIGLQRLVNLQILQMRDNQLTTVDFGRFARCREMVRIDLSNNRLHTILPAPHTGQTAPSRISLPKLKILDLSNNNLNSISFALWDFPTLATLLLSVNRIQRVPSLFNLMPGLQRALLIDNPLLCSNLRSLETDIESFKLSVNEANMIRQCTTSSSFNLPSGRTVCCNE